MFGFPKFETKLASITSRLSMPHIYSGTRKWRWHKVYFEALNIKMLNGSNPHVLITGESGSGKSNACALFLKALKQRNEKFVVIDPHNEFAGIASELDAVVYDAKVKGINIFEADWLSQNEQANEMMSLFKRIFHLGEVQSYTLYKCILYVYKVAKARGRQPTVQDLISMVRAFIAKAKPAEHKVLLGISRRLALLNSMHSSDINTDALLKGRSVMALGNLHSNEAQSVYIEGVLRKIYSRMLTLDKARGSRFYIVIDEAEKVVHSVVLSRIVEEGRKYGIAVIAISQRAKAVDSSIRSNSSTIVSFYRREPEELNYIANLISCGTEQDRYVEVKKAMRNLKCGNAIVSVTGHAPIQVKFNKYKFPRGYLDGKIMELASHGISAIELAKSLDSLNYDAVLYTKHIKQLIDVGSLSYYDFKLGLVESRWYICNPKYTPEHEISINVINRFLSSIGVRNIILNDASHPDLVAYVDGKEIAIEYETGKKSIAETQNMLDRRTRYYACIVITNEEHLETLSKAYSSKAKVLSLYQLTLMKSREEFSTLFGISYFGSASKSPAYRNRCPSAKSESNAPAGTPAL